MNRPVFAPTTPGPRLVPSNPAAETEAPVTAFTVLRAAAVAVHATLTSEAAGDAPAREVVEALTWISAAVGRVLRGQGLERGGPAVSALGIHCIDLLRREVLVIMRSTGAAVGTEELLDLMEALEAARSAISPDWSNKIVSQLIAPSGYELVISLGHDLRSPLTSVLFLADTLRRARSGAVNDLQRHQLGLIYSAALGLSSLTNDVIELARGGEQKEPEPFSLAELLESIRDMVYPIAEEKGVEIRYGVPVVERRVGWPVPLSRVLLNLVTNGLKFTDKGHVEISCKAHGLTSLEFSVRDTGAGIAPDAMENLYEPFRAAGRSKRQSDIRFSGTGLGLAMCRKLLRGMGAELQYETRAGWGTRFYFTLELPPAAKRL